MAMARGGLVAVAVLLLTLAAGAPLAGGAVPADEPSAGAGPAAYETRGPIRIDSEEDLRDNPVVPDSMEDNHGVRRGNGTEDDPYVISRWRIRYNPDEGPGIKVANTDSHVLIRDIVFEPADRGGLLLHIHVVGAANVRVEDLTLPGQRERQSGAQVLILDDARDSVLRDVVLRGNGSIVLDQSRGTTIRNLTLDGWEAWLTMHAGTYVLEDVMVRGSLEFRPGTGGERNGAVVGLGRGQPRRAGPCSAVVRNLTARQVNGWGAGVDDDCRLELHDAEITSQTYGVRVGNGSEALIESTVVRRVGDPDWPAEAGFLVRGAEATIRRSKAEAYPNALINEGSGFTVEWSSLGSLPAPLREPEDRWDVLVKGSCSTCTIHNSSVGSIRNIGSSTVDARWSWWGSSSGPADGDVTGDVRVEPWLSEPPPGVDPGAADGGALPIPVWAAVGGLATASLWQMRRDR